ncbi:hypothetical protein GOP47_0008643 [Adiantum capillus-veneris]|uniref:Uncharacterized protein n=1 Tax=Adiantum capillus-veneris TaxID=13818 RepID=A0A9D4UZQ0_ADICA|nr:hypothetical protein GOP47_0008643 [Adiantum capillus-veneris]
MSKGYAFNHSHILEVSRGASDSSPPSSQQQSRNGRQVAQAQNGDYGQGCVRHMSSPISALSPPHSSNSSDVLSPSGSNYQCDRDMYNNEINSCTYNDGKGKYHLQVSQSPGASSIESPDSTLAFSGNRSNAKDSASLSGNEEALSDSEDMMHKLHALETALMGPDTDDAEVREVLNEKPGPWGELLDDFLGDGQQGPYLHNPAVDKEIKVENTTATALELGSLSFEHALKALNLSSRVKSLLITCAALYLKKKWTEAPAIEVLSAMQKLYEICPYIQFAFMAANGAIAEAFKEEAMVHVFDFQIDQGTQWFSLIQALASRPGGPPCMCISTGDDPTAHSYPLGGMDAVKMRLASFASSLGVPLEFTIISSKLLDLQASMIGRKAGEAQAVNFSLQLHHMPDESVSLDNPRDRILRMCKSLNPKVLMLVEQDANMNTAPFLASRAWDTLFRRKVAFTKKKDFGKEVREAQWAHAQRTMHGLQPAEPPPTILADKGSYHDELAEIAEQAKRRAKIARFSCLK